MQAFWTLVYQSYYYDSLQFFDVMADATYTTWEPVSVPVQWTGFIIVICLLTLHLILVMGIFCYFNKSTQFSKVNDPWLAFTQAYKGELAALLDEMISRGDMNPKAAAEELGKQDDVVGLGFDMHKRAIGIRKIENKSLGNDENDK